MSGRSEIARFLRQRGELGGRELFLDRGSRTETIAALVEALDREASNPGPLSVRPESPARAPASSMPSSHATPPPAPVSGSGSAPVRPEAGAVQVSRTPGEGISHPPLPSVYQELEEFARVCQRCALAKDRTHVVFGDGNPNARLMVVGEAPGANEDRTGVPFVGQAGKLLDLLLASVNLSRRDSVYICNVIKCRPPGNRNPRPEEIDACAPYLRRQIEIIAPEAILAVGTFAAQLLTGSPLPLGQLRGEVYRYSEVPLIVTYHPAALLRNPGWTRPTWDDLQLLRRIMDQN